MACQVCSFKATTTQRKVHRASLRNDKFAHSHHFTSGGKRWGSVFGGREREREREKPLAFHLQRLSQGNRAPRLTNQKLPGVTVGLPPPSRPALLTSSLLESLDSPKTSRNFCRLLPITDETCSAASKPGPSPAAMGWAPETLRREAVTLIRPALLPVPELQLPPGRAGNRHRQLCAILHSLPVCPAIRDTSVGGTLTQHST